MSDRELLELAAKASGIEIATWSNAQAGGFQSQASAEGKFWNPLTDDGDALRLAVKLRLMVDLQESLTDVFGDWPSGTLRECHVEDSLQSTRRAIVRAAAEIGRAMP